MCVTAVSRAQRTAQSRIISIQMYLRYPVRNFKCPFCGTKMPTETFRGWDPWTCPGCSRALQFSKTHGSIVQLCLFGVAFVGLYSMGVVGWHLAVGTLFAGLALAVVLAGPLDRVIPPRLEPYQAPFWKQGKQENYLGLFSDERSDSEHEKEDR